MVYSKFYSPREILELVTPTGRRVIGYTFIFYLAKEISSGVREYGAVVIILVFSCTFDSEKLNFHFHFLHYVWFFLIISFLRELKLTNLFDHISK